MKNRLLLLAFPFLSISLFSQDMNYELHGTYTRAIKQEALQSPKRMSDLIESYPVNWISSYTSAEISANCQGKERTSVSKNDSLSAEQQEILKTADLASNITVTINYSYQVPVTEVVEHNTMHVTMTVVPEYEAQYPGGHQQLMHYLKDQSLQKIPKAQANERQQVLIRFTINEQGKVSDPKLIRSFGDMKTDALFIDLIRNMPQWKAAENPKGRPVKQEFDFIAGRGGGC